MPTQWSYTVLESIHPYTVTKCVTPKVMQNIYEDLAN